MNSSILFYAGLILTIMALMGTISETGPMWSRYFVLGLGLIFLFVFFIKRSRK